MEEKQAPSIVNIATKYGLIQGVLAFIVFLVPTLTHIKQNWETAVVGPALLAVLMILAHQEFKRTHKGMMTYPTGLGSGTLLAIIAAVVTSILVYVYVKYINHGYIAAAIATQRAALQQRGLTGEQAQQAMAITSAILTPAGIVVYSLIVGVIVGFLIALVVSIFTQRGDPRAVI
jgi:hypothetical protein